MAALFVAPQARFLPVLSIRETPQWPVVRRLATLQGCLPKLPVALNTQLDVRCEPVKAKLASIQTTSAYTCAVPRQPQTIVSYIRGRAVYPGL